MRVAVTGATGNVGTSVLLSLVNDPQVESIVGIARRKPSLQLDKVEWVAADIVTDDLVPLFRGADAVVHLAWLIQPSRDRAVTKAVNQDGSRRVFAAVAEAAVPSLVYASSVGAYSPGPKDYTVDESWPTEGVPTSFYSVDKAAVEGMLDSFEDEHPEVRVVRLRPGFIFKREAAAEARRLFLGPLIPSPLIRPEFIKLIPNVPNMRFQALHSYDAGEAYRLAVVGDAHGAFNIAADPILDPHELAEMFGAALLPLPGSALRQLMHWTWRLRLQPSPEGWIDLLLSAPLMDTKRARTDLGWEPRFTSKQSLMELLAGLRQDCGFDTPPLERGTSGAFRWKEFAAGVGKRVIS